MARFVDLTLIGVSIGLVGACGSGDSTRSGPGRPDGGGASGGRGGDSGANGAGGAKGSGGSAGGGGCARFAFVANGADCQTTGCGSFSCACPDAFPISIAKCTPDGCLVGGDCSAICLAHVDGALTCADTYTVHGTGGAGAGGASGSGGATDAAPPQCRPSDVRVPADSAVELGTVALSGPRMIADATGALYIASKVVTGSPVDLGGGTLAAGTSLVLFKLDATKKHVWSHRFGGTFDAVSSLSFAPNGDLLLGGTTSAQTDLGGGPEPASPTPQAFVARYDRNGNYVRDYLAPAPSDLPSPPSVIEMPSGEILLFESFTGSWAIAGRTLTSVGEADIAILRFSATGTLTDIKQFGHGRNDLVFDAVGASDGSIYLVGFSYYSVDFGKNPIDLGTDFSSYVVRLDSSLSPVWQKLIGGGGSYPRRALLDGSTLVVAGDATGTIFYGDKVAGALPSGHTFVFRIDTASGALVRGDTDETTGFGARLTAFAAIPGGGVALGGYISPPADFGNGALTSSMPSYQPFLAEYDSTGKALFSTLFCTTQLVGGASGAIGDIARDTDSTVFVAPFSTDFDVGSARITDSYGSVLVDMPKEP